MYTRVYISSTTALHVKILSHSLTRTSRHCLWGWPRLFMLCHHAKMLPLVFDEYFQKGDAIHALSIRPSLNKTRTYQHIKLFSVQQLNSARSNTGIIYYYYYCIWCGIFVDSIVRGSLLRNSIAVVEGIPGSVLFWVRVGAGYYYMRTLERLVRGNWIPAKNEFLHPSL